MRQALQRQKSVLLLGPRRTGKTTLLKPLQPDLLLNFLRPEVRQRYERAPHLLGAEVEALGERTRGGRTLVALDEVQRVPELVNVVQDLIDRKVARFILTGSSVRKLRRGGRVNLLPGRLVPLRLDPLSLAERVPPTIEEALVYGSLPGIALTGDDAAREEDLRAYTTLYLEEEVRAEAAGAQPRYVRAVPTTGRARGRRNKPFSRYRTGTRRAPHHSSRLLRNPGGLPDRRAG